MKTKKLLKQKYWGNLDMAAFPRAELPRKMVRWQRKPMPSQGLEKAPMDIISKQLFLKSWIRLWTFHSTFLSYRDTWDKMYENSHVFEVAWFICIGFSNGGETKDLAGVTETALHRSNHFYVGVQTSPEDHTLCQLHKSLPTSSLVCAPILELTRQPVVF